MPVAHAPSDEIGAPLLGGFLIGRGDLATWALVAAGAALLGAVAGVWGSQRMPKHAAMEAKEA